MSGSPITIDCLGELRLRFRGDPLALPATPKARELLAFLVARRGVPTGRAALALALWPDELEGDARANLRRHLHRIRQALPGEGALLEDAAGIAIVATQVESDLWNCEAALARGDVDAALALYGGEFCAGIDTAWALAARTRLIGELVRGFVGAARGAQQDLDYDRATQYARAALGLDPWREDVVRISAEIAYDAGDKARALHDIDTYVARLAAEFAAPPMPETLALRDAVRRDARRAAVPAHVPGGAVRLELPFVGRAHALAQLESAYAEAAGGRGRTVLVSGEAGIGKSRLCAHGANLLEARGARILAGSTSPLETQPYEPFIELVRNALPFLASSAIDRVWLAALRSVVPEIGELQPAVDAAPPTDPERERGRLFEAFFRVFVALAETRPLVLVIDDLQYAGPGTIELFGALCRRFERKRIVQVVAFRDGSAMRRVRRAPPAGGFAAIRLGRLELHDVAELIARTVSPADPAALLARSDGNPFFLGELLRQPTPHEGAPDARMAAALVAERFAALGETAQHTAEAAAAIGSAFDVEMLHAVTGWTVADVDAALDELLDASIVREAPRSRRTDYLFSHQIVQEAVYRQSDPTTRRRRHARIARALERLHAHDLDERAAELAHQYEAAEQLPQAAAAYLRAARAAARVFAHEDAVAHATRGLALVSAHDVRFDLLLTRELANARLGNRDAQALDLAELERLASVLADPSRAFEAARRRFVLVRLQGEPDAQAAAAQTLVDLARREEDHCDAALANADLSLYAGHVQAAGDAAARAEDLARALDDQARLIDALCLRAAAALARADFAVSARFIEGARTLAQGNPAASLRTLRAAVRLETARSDSERLAEVADAMLHIAREVGDRESEADALAYLGFAGAVGGNDVAAAAHFAAATRLYEAQANRRGRAIVNVNHLVLDYRRGAVHDVVAHARQAAELFEALGDAHGVMVAQANVALALLYLGDWTSAKAAAESALARARAEGDRRVEAQSLTVAGAAERELGFVGAAVDRLEEAVAAWDALGELIGQPESLAQAALAHLAAADPGAAIRAIDRLNAIDSGDPTRSEMPQQMLWARAQVLHGVGRTAEATEYAAQAHACVEERLHRIDDAHISQRYRELPLNREIADAALRARWPERARAPSRSA